MEEFLYEYGPVFGMVIFMLAAVPFSVRMAKKQREKIKKSVSMVGLQFNEKQIQMPFLGAFGGAWDATGEYEGVKVRFHTFKKGSGKNSKTYTKFEAYFENPFHSDLHISHEGLGSKLAQVIKGKDLQTGNPDFDSKVLIRTSSESEVRSPLSRPELQQGLIKFFDEFKNSHVQDDAIIFNARGTIYDVDRLRTILGEMARLVKMFKS